MKQKIHTEFHTNKSYFYFSTLIAVLTLIPQLLISPNSTQTFFLVVTLLLLTLIPKFSKPLFAVFIVFISLSNILIGHIALHWGYASPDIQPRIEVAFLSPDYETLEYLASYIDYRDFALFAHTALVWFLLYRFLRHFTHSYRIFRFVALGAFLAILTSVTFFINPLRELEPFSVPSEVCSVMEDKEQIDRILRERETFIRQLLLPPAGQKKQLYDKVVIILGESANKRHMSLYGYALPTTPFLDSLRRSSNLYVMDAIAPTNQTRFSIPIDLTDATVREYEKRFLRSCSVLTRFKANGYETYWISNQGRAGKNDSTLSSMAYEADTTLFANLNYLDAKTDRVLLHYLDKIRTTPGKEFYLLHLMGSHSDYINRYEEETALFKNAKNVVEEYDNSIHYTDAIVRQIFERFKGEKLLLVYLSDHGENISLENNGHGFLPPYKDEYTVPFVIYSTVKNPRLEELYRDNKKGAFNLEHFAEMIQYLSGLSDQKKISYSRDVMAVEPGKIYNFDKLEDFE